MRARSIPAAFADLRHESTVDLVRVRHAIESAACRAPLSPRDAARLDACRVIIRARRNASRQFGKV